MDKLVAQANSRIALGGQDLEDTARLVGIANAVDATYSVPTAADLPPAANNVGRMIRIADTNVYRYSNGTEWTNDYDTTFVARVAQIWSWGRNACGQLGDGTAVAKSSPVREFYSATDWCSVSAGGVHAAAVKTDGTLWSWGQGSVGRLGDGTVTIKSSPVREISSSTNWCTVSAGIGQSLAIKNNGTLWGWGDGGCGRLGTGSSADRCSPVQEFCSATNWCAISTGDDHSLAIKTDGTLWGWGQGTFGRLGNGTALNRCSPVREISSSTNWCAVSVNMNHSSAIKTDGTLWSMGCARCGKLGDGTSVDKCSPVRERSSSTNWRAIAAGAQHSAAIKTDGTLWSWGDGACGSLGDGTVTSKCSPVREISSSTNWCSVSGGSFNSSAIKTDGTLWGWGSNFNGKIGDNTTTPKSSPVQEITSSTTWCDVSNSIDECWTTAIKLLVETKGFNAI